MKLKFAVTLIFSVLLFSGAAWTLADDTIFFDGNKNAFEGYNNISWGTSLENFKLSQKSFTTHIGNKIELCAINHAMLDFHEADKNYHPVKITIESIPGRQNYHVFYNNQYCLTATLVPPAALSDVEKIIANKYWKKDLTKYVTPWETHKTSNLTLMEFDYQRYELTSGTRIYMVTASSYSQDQAASGKATPTKTTVANILIYVSDDYLNSNKNAWADHQAVKP